MVLFDPQSFVEYITISKRSYSQSCVRLKMLSLVLPLKNTVSHKIQIKLPAARTFQ